MENQEIIYSSFLLTCKPMNQLFQIDNLDHAHSQGILEVLVDFSCGGAAVTLGVNNVSTASATKCSNEIQLHK